MEQLVKILHNVGNLVEIIHTSRTQNVNNWDTEALQRAHDWTKYFEQVYAKLHQKPVFVTKLNKHMKLKYDGIDTKHSLGDLEVNFELFGQARKILLQSLLQNPHLSKALYSHVIELYKQIPQIDDEQSHQLVNDTVTYGRNKTAVMVLSKIKNELSQTMSVQNPQRVPSVCAKDVYIQTEAVLLYQHLRKLLEKDQPKMNIQKALADKLDDLAKAPRGLEVIVVMLISHNDMKLDDTTMEQYNHMVMTWLLQQCSGNQNRNSPVWKLPCGLLGRLAATYFTFFKTYIVHLVKWGNDMRLQYDETAQRQLWRHSHDPTNPTFCWNRLTESFVNLMEGPQFLIETVKRLLHNLSQSSNLMDIGTDLEPPGNGNNIKLWTEIQDITQQNRR